MANITYDQSAALMNDQAFFGRCKVCALKFANFIMDEAPTQLAHNTRMRWAYSVLYDTDAQTRKIVPNVVMDPAVQAAGSGITDAALQTAFETAAQDLL